MYITEINLDIEADLRKIHKGIDLINEASVPSLLTYSELRGDVTFSQLEKHNKECSQCPFEDIRTYDRTEGNSLGCVQFSCYNSFSGYVIKQIFGLSLYHKSFIIKFLKNRKFKKLLVLNVINLKK